MSRKIKNIIMIVIILIVCVLSYFTMKGAAQSSMPNKASFENDFEGKIPNFNNDEFSEENMPQIPSNGNGNREIPDKEQLPENFNKGDFSEGFDESKNLNFDEMPEGFEENFKNGNFSKESFKSNISAIYYILFAVEGLIVSSLLIYLVMSKFNNKTLKETLASKKIIVFIISVLIITIVLTITQSVLTKKVFTASNMMQFENRQIPRNNNNVNDTNGITDTNKTNDSENI